MSSKLKGKVWRTHRRHKAELRLSLFQHLALMFDFVWIVSAGKPPVSDAFPRAGTR
ncbi:hypothetical protein SAMN05421823_102242 [Catalinimonas alkaloidigena]|uniref:Uncharacterized protein n=1 Tax=Catalinimonas alkaloidigena TaxID=1075417 RepID=A0A1G9ABM4_9BACT|nr:hypothetical protein SAMN05421823_102242 [Catalinimonas alkaloidigena]